MDVAPATRKCSHTCCRKLVPIDHPFKRCDTCRETARRYTKTEKGKAALKRNKHTEKGIASRKRWNTSESRRAWKREWSKTKKGKAAVKRCNDRPMHSMLVTMSRMLGSTRKTSRSVIKLTEFKNCADFNDHLRSTFEPWMTFKNRGRHKSGDPHKTRWNIGHIIPRSAYDGSDVDDVRKCWSKKNLFAQCARENLELCDRLPNQEVLDRLRDVWPASWRVGSSV